MDSHYTVCSVLCQLILGLFKGDFVLGNRCTSVQDFSCRMPECIRDTHTFPEQVRAPLYKLLENEMLLYNLTFRLKCGKIPIQLTDSEKTYGKM